MEREIRQIGNTPLSIAVYSVESSPTHMHSPGMVEIIFCLKGSVRFGYAYEDFTLRAGDYMAVDRDAYFLYKGRDNLCVSFYLDLSRYKEKYPYIMHELVVCEGTPETDVKDYPTKEHMRMKGLMIAAMKAISDGDDGTIVQTIADEMVDLIVNHFDIAFYHYGSGDMPEKRLKKVRAVTEYIHQNLTENVSVDEIAGKLGVTGSYLSEFMRKDSIGFRGMVGYLRANRSEWYLLNTDKTIIEISEECGFSDTKYFYEAFKRWYKCTPRQFREKYGKITDTELENVPLSEAEEIIDSMMREHFMSIYTDAQQES